MLEAICYRWVNIRAPMLAVFMGYGIYQ